MNVRCGGRPLVAKTCKRCGKLKMASEFRDHTLRNGIKHGECIPCMTIYVNGLTAARNEKSKEAATRNGNIWTDRDMNTMISMFQHGKTADEVAVALGRTLIAVYSKKTQVFIPKRPFKATPGQPIDLEFIRSYIEEYAA